MVLLHYERFVNPVLIFDFLFFLRKKVNQAIIFILEDNSRGNLDVKNLVLLYLHMNLHEARLGNLKKIETTKK